MGRSSPTMATFYLAKVVGQPAQRKQRQLANYSNKYFSEVCVCEIGAKFRLNNSPKKGVR